MFFQIIELCSYGKKNKVYKIHLKLLLILLLKVLNKDSDPSFVSEGMWTHAVNVVNNTIEGDIGTLSNEISNFLCALAGATMPATVTKKYIIGAIYLYSDKWIIFTAGHNMDKEKELLLK
jgi:hypothetical protein